MVTIMQDILENKIKDDDNDNENSEEKKLEKIDEKEEKVHVFGVTVNPNILHGSIQESAAQSDYYRIEAIRIYLENELGDDVLF